MDATSSTPQLTRWVGGIPHPQGSKSAIPRKGGGPAIVVEGKNAAGRMKLREWRTAVARIFTDAVTEVGWIPLDGPVYLGIDFLMPKGSSLPKWKIWAVTKPDADKLLRSTMDALKLAGVYTDDARVVWPNARKRYAIGTAPGAWITVAGIDPRAEPGSMTLGHPVIH